MLRITDKSFRYTPSFETDLAKKFRKMERDRRQAAGNAKAPDAAVINSSVLNLRRTQQK